MVKDGKVRLDVTVSNTKFDPRTKGRIQFHTDMTRTITTIRLGEVVKLRCGKGSADHQTWAEVSVGAVEP